MNAKIPSGCYATDEWDSEVVLEDGSVVHEHCTQYVRASDGEIVGTFVRTFAGTDYIGSEFVSWD